MRYSYACRRGIYVICIMTKRPSFRRRRGEGRSNKFGQMQELINDTYSDSIFRIEYKDIECITNKKESTITCPIRH